MLDNLFNTLIDEPTERDVDNALIALHDAIDYHFQLVNDLLNKKDTPPKIDELLLEYMSSVLVIKRYYEREILECMGIPFPAPEKHGFFDATEADDGVAVVIENVVLSQARQFKMAIGTIMMIAFTVTRNIPKIHSINEYNALQQTKLPVVEKWFDVLENHVEFILRSFGIES